MCAWVGVSVRTRAASCMGARTIAAGTDMCTFLSLHTCHVFLDCVCNWVCKCLCVCVCVCVCLFKTNGWRLIVHVFRNVSNKLASFFFFFFFFFYLHILIRGALMNAWMFTWWSGRFSLVNAPRKTNKMKAMLLLNCTQWWFIWCKVDLFKQLVVLLCK